MDQGIKQALDLYLAAAMLEPGTGIGAQIVDHVTRYDQAMDTWNENVNTHAIGVKVRGKPKSIIPFTDGHKAVFRARFADELTRSAAAIKQNAGRVVSISLADVAALAQAGFEAAWHQCYSA